MTHAVNMERINIALERRGGGGGGLVERRSVHVHIARTSTSLIAKISKSVANRNESQW